LKKTFLLTLITVFACIMLFTACSESEHTHTFGEWATVSQATCSEKGAQQRVCECGETEKQEIAKTPHTEAIQEGIAPTCASIGFTEGKICSVCNTVLVMQEIIPQTAHTEAILNDVIPTCTSIGFTAGKICSVCNTVLVAQKVVPATGHIEAFDSGITPTCTSIGLSPGTHCSVCYTVLSAQMPIRQKNHKYSQDIMTNDNLVSLATCTEPAKYYEVCSCGARSGNVFYTGKVKIDVHTTTETYQKYVIEDEYWHSLKLYYKCCNRRYNTIEKEVHELVNDVCIVCNYSPYKDFVVTSKNREKIGFTGEADESLVIPSEFTDTDGTLYRVVGIGESAFFNCENLKSVILPDTITTIGSGAFFNCTNLESCIIQEGVTHLSGTFYNCKNLKNVTLPDSITTIGGSTFECCYQLTEITLPKNLRSLDDSAFRFCSNLKSIIIPEKVSFIGYAAFEHNDSLYSITLPNTLRFIDEFVFSSCNALHQIIFQGTKAEWEKIVLGTGWNQYTYYYMKIYCTDGVITPNSSGS